MMSTNMLIMMIKLFCNIFKKKIKSVYFSSFGCDLHARCAVYGFSNKIIIIVWNILITFLCVEYLFCRFSVLYVITLPLSENVPLNAISNDSSVIYQVFSCCDYITASSNGYFVSVNLNDAGTLALTQVYVHLWPY